MQKLKEFLKALETPDTVIQISELETLLPVFSLEEVCAMQKNVYMLAGVKKGLQGRAKDADIIEKNYMAFDFDLLKDKGYSPEQIKVELMAATDFLLAESSSLKNILAVVFSGGGGHIYYRTPLIRDFKNWRGVYKQAMAALEKTTGWKADGACQNPGRIMRLPGSWNVKRNPPVQTEILYFNPVAEPFFSLEKYLNYKPTNVKTSQQKSGELQIKLSDLNNTSIRRLPNKKMLELLSGSPLVNGEVFTFRHRSTGGEYIDVNGEPANAWLDEKGLIGSGAGAGPTWVDWLLWYGRKEKEIYMFLFEHGITQAQEKQTEGYEIDKQVAVYTWGTARLNAQLSPITGEQSNLITGNTSAGKTTFAFDVAWKNAELGHRVLYLSLEMSRAEIETRLARSAAGITKSEWRERAGITEYKKSKFKSTIDDLKKLKTLMLSGMPEGNLPTTENIFKLIKATSPDLVFIDNFDLIQKRVGVSSYEEENRISAELKDFPKKTQIPLIILHHRGKSKNGTIDGVRGSGKITHDRYTALRCEREFSEDASPEQNAQFHLVEEKDRDFGHGKKTMVYFKNGSFYDTF